ncbi:MAG: DUF481 domain-containing protein [Bacteroidota bacterium]
MKTVKVCIVTFVAVLSGLTALAQVMNIEQERIKTDTTGWAGSAKLSAEYTKNGQDLWTGSANVHVQFKTKRSLYLSLTEYNLTKGSGSDFVNAGAQHFRYNYKIKDWFTAEAFTQAQFNKVLKVKIRWLVGAGPRFKVINTKPFRLYAATLYMYEHEELYDTNIVNRNNRLSNYLSFTLKIKDNLSLLHTSYYQPKVNQFSDYRILSQSDLKISISKHFSFLFSYLYTYDTFPAIGVPKETHYFGNSIEVNF